MTIQALPDEQNLRHGAKVGKFEFFQQSMRAGSALILH
jgi:hypothetical protein